MNANGDGKGIDGNTAIPERAAGKIPLNSISASNLRHTKADADE